MNSQHLHFIRKITRSLCPKITRNYLKPTVAVEPIRVCHLTKGFHPGVSDIQNAFPNVFPNQFRCHLQPCQQGVSLDKNFHRHKTLWKGSVMIRKNFKSKTHQTYGISICGFTTPPLKYWKTRNHRFIVLPSSVKSILRCQLMVG